MQQQAQVSERSGSTQRRAEPVSQQRFVTSRNMISNQTQYARETKTRLSQGRQVKKNNWLSPVVSKNRQSFKVHQNGPLSTLRKTHLRNQSPSSYQRVSTSASEAMQSYLKFQQLQQRVGVGGGDGNGQSRQRQTSQTNFGFDGPISASQGIDGSIQNLPNRKTSDGFNRQQEEAVREKNSIYHQKYLIQTSNDFTPSRRTGMADHTSVKSAFLQETKDQQIRQSAPQYLPDQQNQPHNYFKLQTRQPTVMHDNLIGGEELQRPTDDSGDVVEYVDKSISQNQHQSEAPHIYFLKEQPSKDSGIHEAKRKYANRRAPKVDRDDLIDTNLPMADPRTSRDYHSDEDNDDGSPQARGGGTDREHHLAQRYKSPFAQNKSLKQLNQMTHSHSSKMFDRKSGQGQRLESGKKPRRVHTSQKNAISQSRNDQNVIYAVQSQMAFRQHSQQAMMIAAGAPEFISLTQAKAIAQAKGHAVSTQNIKNPKKAWTGVMTSPQNQAKHSTVSGTNANYFKGTKTQGGLHQSAARPSNRRKSLETYREKDHVAEAKKNRQEIKTQREKMLKKLQATMVPKELSEHEQEMVVTQLNDAYRNHFVVPTDNVLTKHISSYQNSQDDAKYTFNSYMHNFLTLNRELRTDANGITTLLDNVPSVFALPEAKTQCFYQFTVNFDLNLSGSIKIFFESKKRVRLFVSDQFKKPQASNCDKVILPEEVPKTYKPFKNQRKDLFAGNNSTRHLYEQKPVYNHLGQISEKQVYITVQADEGPAHGRIHIRTEVTMAQLKSAYNDYLDKNKSTKPPITSMLKEMENKYGSKSGVVQQLTVLMEENDRMRRLAQYDKNNNRKKDHTSKRNKEEVNFIEQNKFEARKSKDALKQEQEARKLERKQKARALKVRKFQQDLYNFEYRYQGANRLVIKKILMTKYNEKMHRHFELRNRIKAWVANAYLYKICKLIDKRRKIIKAVQDKLALEDAMARRIQGWFLRKMYKNSLTVRQKKRMHNKPALVSDKVFKVARDRDPQLARQLRKLRSKMTDLLVQRTIVFSARTFGGQLSGIKKVQVDRARLVVKDFIQRDAMGQSFFRKCRDWVDKMTLVKQRLTNQILRRRYKKMVLRNYWKAVVDRCQRLQLRNQSSVLKRFQGTMLDQISEKIRDEIIDQSILIQEEKYMENLAKFRQQIKESRDPKQRVCSRLLKYLIDQYSMERSYDQDEEIIKTQIDACLPLVDPMKELEKKKSQTKGKKKGAQEDEKPASKGSTPVASKKASLLKKSTSSDSNPLKASTTSLKRSDKDLTVLRETQEDAEDDTDSELELQLEKNNHDIHNEEESLTLEEINTRRAEAQERYERRKKKIEDQEFTNQLRMFSLLTPSMEFIPKFNEFITIMQQGLVSSRSFKETRAGASKKRIVRGTSQTARQAQGQGNAAQGRRGPGRR